MSPSQISNQTMGKKFPLGMYCTSTIFRGWFGCWLICQNRVDLITIMWNRINTITCANHDYWCFPIVYFTDSSANVRMRPCFDHHARSPFPPALSSAAYSIMQRTVVRATNRAPLLIQQGVESTYSSLTNALVSTYPGMLPPLACSRYHECIACMLHLGCAASSINSCKTLCIAGMRVFQKYTVRLYKHPCRRREDERWRKIEPLCKPNALCGTPRYGGGSITNTF